MANVFVAVGSNLGDRQANIDRALTLLREEKEIRLVKNSSWKESRPQGGPEQGPYLNGVIQIETDLMPLDLLSKLKNIERRLGRVKSEERNLPRPMDLDILSYDDVVIVDGKSLTIPHPRLQERVFVMEPLAEIAPDWVHPRSGKTIKQLLDELRYANTSHGQ